MYVYFSWVCAVVQSHCLSPAGGRKAGFLAGFVAEFITALTWRSQQSLGLSNNQHCSSKQEVNRESAWSWPVLRWAFWFINSFCSSSGDWFCREASFRSGEATGAPHWCVDLVRQGVFHASLVGLCGTLSWGYCLFCLWENNSTFYPLTRVCGKMARGRYSPADLAGIWDGVVIAVPECAL